jgi:hypothetical protein
MCAPKSGVIANIISAAAPGLVRILISAPRRSGRFRVDCVAVANAKAAMSAIGPLRQVLRRKRISALG